MTYNILQPSKFPNMKILVEFVTKLGSQSESGVLSEAKIGTAGTVLSLVGKMFLGFSGDVPLNQSSDSRQGAYSHMETKQAMRPPWPLGAERWV